MAKSRSTYSVADLRATVNKALNLEVEGNDPQFRNGLAAVLEDVLMKTGNYKGFQFTDGNRGRTDHTRRTYY